MKYFLFILLFSTTVLGFSQQEEVLLDSINTSDTADIIQIENSLLWQLVDTINKDTSYLFGTIHMIDKEDFFISDVVQKHFDECTKVVFEVNTEDMFDLGTQFSLLMKSFMEGNVRIRDLVSEEDYKLIQDHFNDIGLPLMLLDRIKPMILSIFASEDMSKGGLSMDNIKSYELELTDMAKQQDKTIAGLETLEYQMSMFDSIPYEVQAEMLVEAIKSESSGGDEMAKMVEMYKNQDIKAMHAMIQGDNEGVGKFDQLLLVNRNKNWIPIIKDFTSKEKVFYAVGAGHLGGKNGVINLLREANFLLKPLKN